MKLSRQQVYDYRLEICNQIFQLEDSLKGKNRKERKVIYSKIRELGRKLDYFIQPEKKMKMQEILDKEHDISRQEMLFLFNGGMSVPEIAKRANMPLRKVRSQRDYALKFGLINHLK